MKLANGKYRVYCKGAAEMVLAICTARLNEQGGVEPMTDKKDEEKLIRELAAEALRTICLAYKDVDAGNLNSIEEIDGVEKDLTMIAIVGIEDPVRKEVPPAIADCKKAGITVRMVTGDNMITAAAIAKQ